jgi:ABC-type branched-subunit amino acid transport system ATPase component
MSTAEHAHELRNVTERFGRAEIIRGANFAACSGERVAVIGLNGAGKRTLFNLGSVLAGGQAARAVGQGALKCWR